MSSRSAIVLACALHVLRPLARLLLRNGVAYPAFAVAMKKVFLDAAHDELRDSGKKPTDSAVSLMSGVHRRDVRNLGRLAEPQAQDDGFETPLNMASQVVARWLSQPDCLDDEGQPRPLPRTGDAPHFDAIVASISSDVRPRAVLDELVRLGMAQEDNDHVTLLATGFVPRQGFAEMAQLMQDNLHDHIAAAALNLQGEHNYLEQAVFVDQLSDESARRLHAVAAKAWRQAFKTVMTEAQARFDHDQQHTDPNLRIHRARFGSYFYAADKDDHPS
ncbi:MAG: DUF6502 family protein [Acidovorax sp.]|uniref:DUF6502 family protein n=1 Tax=Acidovorax sp. TaxID=1872122 RepID=UPI00391DF64D